MRDARTNSPFNMDSGLRMRLRGESRRIASQHQQLDTLFGAVFQALDRGGLHLALQAFRRFRDALEAHMEVEENLYFPALRGLQPDLASQLDALEDAHSELVEVVVEAEGLLGTGDRGAAIERLEMLAFAISKHEAEEEDLVSSAQRDAPGRPKPRAESL